MSEVCTEVMEDSSSQYVWNLPKTKLDILREHMHSSIFVPCNADNYCTVSTTAVVIDEELNGTYVETSYEHTCHNYLTRMLSNHYEKSTKILEF